MKKEIKEELEMIAPIFEKLSKLEEKRGAMPADYFNSFQSRVMHQIKELDALKSKSKVKESPAKSSWIGIIQSFFSPKMAMAFSILIVFGISLLFFSNERAAVFAFEADEVQNYIASNDVNIEDEWIESTENFSMNAYSEFEEASVSEYLDNNQEEQL